MSSLNLVKGEKIDLTKTNPGLKSIRVGLGWDINTGNGDPFDVDAFMFALKDTPPRLKDIPEGVLYFNSPKTGNPANAKELGILGGAATHSGDNLTGEGVGDDETMIINFDKVPAGINEFVVGANIFKAVERSQTFGRIKNAYMKIYDGDKGTELAKYDLNEDYSSFNAVIAGRVYLHNGEWKFEAQGLGKNGDLTVLANSYS